MRTSHIFPDQGIGMTSPPEGLFFMLKHLAFPFRSLLALIRMKGISARTIGRRQGMKKDNLTRVALVSMVCLALTAGALSLAGGLDGECVEDCQELYGPMFEEAHATYYECRDSGEDPAICLAEYESTLLMLQFDYDNCVDDCRTPSSVPRITLGNGGPYIKLAEKPHDPEN
jgi:hypothetical protein